MTPNEERKVKRRAQQKLYREENQDKRRVANKLYRETHQDERRAYSMHYREENREELREYSKRYREKNSDKEKARSTRWQVENPEKARANDKRYRENHRAERYASSKYWKETHRAQWNQYVLARKRKMGIITEQTLAAVYDYYGPNCVYCGGPTVGGVDHLQPVAKGGTNDVYNLAPCCSKCNSRKHVHPMWEMLP